jgi:2-(1,2-epoxy-1,2-dihydrophenyl)acetyl-CoA isomerase
MATSDDLLVERDGDVLLLIFNRPEKMNAVSPAMFGVLMDQLEAVKNRGAARALVLTGNGRGFCAGADLSASGKLVENRATIEESMNRGVTTFITALTELPVPVIAAVNGAAAGVGLGFALAADLVICARSARFLTAFSRIGAVCDGGLSWTLPRKIGSTRAFAMAAFAGDSIDAQTALEWGLVWRVFDDAELRSEALALARRLAEGPTQAYALIKEELRYAQTATLGESLLFEAASQGKAFATADFVEGVDAYQKKRKPKFNGR